MIKYFILGLLIAFSLTMLLANVMPKHNTYLEVSKTILKMRGTK
jgi:hypothetical protein